MTTASGVWDLHKALRVAIAEQIRSRAHTEQELSRKTGISQPHISAIIRGTRRASLLYLDELATAAGITISTVIETVRPSQCMAEITTGAQSVTTSGAVTGTLDASGFTIKPVIKLDVISLTPTGATARIAIEDSAAGDFSDAQAAAIFDVSGIIAKAAEVSLSQTPDLMPSLRVGAANNKLRCNVLNLSTGATLVLHAYTA